MNQALFVIDTSADDPTPVYHVLEKTIQARIEDGELTADDPIPPERVIAQMNAISLATVRKALQNLVQNGFLHRIQGKGTFVSNSALRRDKIRYYPLAKHFRDDICKIDIKRLELRQIKGEPQINRYLKIRSDQDVYKLRRVMIQNRKPIIYSISYLPCSLFPGLENYKDHYFEKEPLYIFLEQEFGVSTMKNLELYGAISADQIVAEILNVQVGHPLLLVEMQALSHKEKPYEYRISYCLTDERKIRRII